MSNSFQLKIASSPQSKLAYTNRVYVNKATFNQLGRAAQSLGVKITGSDPAVNIIIGQFVFLTR